MKQFLGAGVLLCALGSAAQGADTYSTYQNARFGYTASYPANLVAPRPEAPNGDGRAFKSRDGKVTLSVWGENNVLNRTLGAQMNFAKSDWLKDRARVTYARLGQGFYVLSGFTGKEIFYEKTVPLKGGFATILWQYPQSRKAALSDAVTRTTRAFGPSRRVAAKPSVPVKTPPLAPRVAVRTPEQPIPEVSQGY